MRRWGIAALATVSAVMLLTGCTGEAPSVADDSFQGLPGSSTGPDGGTGFSDSARGEWITRNQTFAITTWGSSSCPLVPTGIESVADDAVTIHFESSPQEVCTADMAPTTHEFTVPTGSESTPLSVTLTYADWDVTDSIILE